MFSATGSMAYTHEAAAAVKLADGRVLVTGGYVTGFSKAEIYDPAFGHFTTTVGDMQVGRSLHSATLLANGEVLIVGGFDASSASIATAELFDPVAGTFTLTGSLAKAR